MLHFKNVEDAIVFIEEQFGYDVDPSAIDGHSFIVIDDEDEERRWEVKDKEDLFALCNELWDSLKETEVHPDIIQDVEESYQ